MSTTIVKALDQYYLAKRNSDTKEQLAIADDLVARLIPELLGTKAPEPTESLEEETIG
jgi:hypothetical protein